MFSPQLDAVTRIFMNGANLLVVDDNARQQGIHAN
jgi:hypothetical protein